ncbi:hypothetical protein [Paenibacillus lutimineralis]|uniref:Uncharacterized protein n=1 Tax=Paenibacillus lutimineralis TaxID=2707005 RepID=A0A3S9UUG2_9BACL|nr:hypothetical protein [Paenibacillus lutimineralis]AZS13979.1 hypothetical protein EI981_05615 [Paenibacillus lutimineralis]
MKIFKNTKEMIAILLTLAIGYKVISSNITISELSIPDNITNILSLVLAIFSVLLSALFYFKANETSNNFYNNTYQFTKDISEKIGRIEERFGKDLSNIEKSYSRMLDKIDRTPLFKSIEEEIENKTNNQIKLVKEKEEIINQLIQGADISQEEKQKIINQLRSKEEELADLKGKLYELENQLDLFKNKFWLGPHTKNIVDYIIKGMISRGEIPENYKDFLKIVEGKVQNLSERELRLLIVEGLLTPEYNLSRIGRKLIIQSLKEES